jgi:motility quorum-sensing regulator/GCU-specific mRNA interferase toxin
MEKRVPHYDLVAIQIIVREAGAAAFTKSALDGGRAMGLTSAEMAAVVTTMTRRHFYKAMTTYADHRIWQDVYRTPTPAGKWAYVKITLRAAVPVIQFKEL